ncbi:hypothetical protein MKX03_024556 [Papaver bracteatum]|nr:hypothetical protein MKX03_024556 [Papaver bracteatum]
MFTTRIHVFLRKMIKFYPFPTKDLRISIRISAHICTYPIVSNVGAIGIIPERPHSPTVVNQSYKVFKTRPIGKTVTDAVYVLDEMVGYDEFDKGGYKQFLKKDGLVGKRIGVVRNPFYIFPAGSTLIKLFTAHMASLKQAGAVIVDHLAITNINTVLNPNLSGQDLVEKFELKVALNDYLEELVSSPVRSIADVIAFNYKYTSLEKTAMYGQEFFIASQKTSGKIGAAEIKVLEKVQRLDEYGFVSLMIKNKLDAIVTPGTRFSTVLSLGGHPGINVPARYKRNGMPIGITFGGLRGSEPKLIEISYAFEQLTLARKPPSYRRLTKTLNTVTDQEGIDSSDSLIDMM